MALSRRALLARTALSLPLSATALTGGTFLQARLAGASESRAPREEKIKHKILFFEYGKGPNRLLELDADGKVVWEHKPPSITVIFQVLPNGNLLYAYGGKPTGVREVTRKGRRSGTMSVPARRCWGASGCPTATRWWRSRGLARRLRWTPRERWCASRP